MDINEIICNSVKTIVDARINELNFDKTVICTVVDASTRDQGYVTVTDGQLEFKAYSTEDIAAVNGTKFYVTIPMGDYSQKKLIVGKYTDETQTEKIEHFNPLDQMVIYNTIQDNDRTYNLPISIMPTSRSLLANTDPNNFVFFYDTLYLSAEFKCSSLSKERITSGIYGIKFNITYLNDANLPESITVTLQSDKDMFGNVYAFDSFYKQEATYSLSANLISRIQNIAIEAFQDGQFKHIVDDGSSFIEQPFIDENLGIEIRNVKAIIGKTAKDIPDKTLALYCVKGNKYGTSANDISRKIQSLWFNSNEDGKQIGFKDQDTYDYFFSWMNYNSSLDKATILPPANKEYKEVLYLYNPSTINSEGPIINFSFNFGVPQEKVKLTLKRRKKTDKEEEKFITLEGGYVGFTEASLQAAPLEEYAAEIIFTNDSADKDLLRYDESNALKIELGDGATEAYVFYGDDGMITKPVESSRKRTLMAVYKPEFNQSRKNLVGAEIKWKIPKEDKSMLIQDESLKPPSFEDLETQNNNLPEEERYIFNFNKEIFEAANYNTELSINDDTTITKDALIKKLFSDIKFHKFYEEENYYVFSRIIQAIDTSVPVEEQKARSEDLKFRYQVKEYFANCYDDNTIHCFVNLEPEKTVEGSNNDGRTRASQKFLFSSSGNNGTNYTFIVDSESGHELIFTNDNGTEERYPAIKLTPKVYNTEGKLVENLQFEYKYYGVTTDWQSMTDSYLLTYDHFYRQQYDYLTFRTNVDWLNKSTTISYIYPIICHEEGYTSNLPVKIHYDAFGKRKLFEFDPVKLYKDNKEIDCTWFLVVRRDDLSPPYSNNHSWTEELKIEKDEETNNQYLTVPNLYYECEKGEKFAIGARIGNTEVYCSPLIFIQDKNSSPILNEWDGGTSFSDPSNLTGKDEKRVMSASFIAGKKNFTDNSFSGVIMGDINHAAGNSEDIRKQGLFGFDSGVETFALTIDGKLALGKAGSGQIIFEPRINSATQEKEYEAIIQSGNYDGSQGMQINLTKGFIDAYDFKLTGKDLYLSSNEPELNTNALFRVGGLTYTQDNNLYIGNGFRYYEDYYGSGPRLEIGKSSVSSYGVKRDSIPDTEVYLGGWDVGADGLYRQVDGQITAGLFIGYEADFNFNKKIEKGLWTILVGDNDGFNFGVTSQGEMYAKGANISGTIQAQTGSIGSWLIQEDGSGSPALYGEASAAATEQMAQEHYSQTVIIAPWGMYISYHDPNNTSAYGTKTFSWVTLLNKLGI